MARLHQMARPKGRDYPNPSGQPDNGGDDELGSASEFI